MNLKHPIPDDHRQLEALRITLLNEHRRDAAAYIEDIMRTDLAEFHALPTNQFWPCPGQAPPPGWRIYAQVLEALHGGLSL